MTVWTEDDAGSVVADKWASRAFARASAYNAKESEARDFGGSWGVYGDGSIPPPWFDGAAGYGGQVTGPMDEQRALTHGTVLACISLLTDTVMQVPLCTYRKTKTGREQIDDAPLIADPNPELFKFDFEHQTAESLIGSGNTFLQVTDRDRLGYPRYLQPVHPDTVQVRRNKQGRKEAVISGSYAQQATVVSMDGPLRDMVHIPGFTVPGALVGLNRIGKAMVTIYSGLAAEGYGASWFRDSANPSSILTTKEQVGKETVLEAQRQWIATHGGRRLPAVMSGGFEWKPISISPDESQFIETQRWSTTQIARWWRCPPHLIGDVDRTTSWGTGIEEQTLGFLTYSVNTYLLRIEQAFSTLLPRGTFCKHNVEALLRGRTLDRYMSYVHARNAGWLNVDEIRAREDLPPVPGGAGQEYIQPLNMGPLGTEPPEPKDPNEPPDPEGGAGA